MIAWAALIVALLAWALITGILIMLAYVWRKVAPTVKPMLELLSPSPGAYDPGGDVILLDGEPAEVRAVPSAGDVARFDDGPTSSGSLVVRAKSSSGEPFEVRTVQSSSIGNYGGGSYGPTDDPPDDPHAESCRTRSPDPGPCDCRPLDAP